MIAKVQDEQPVAKPTESVKETAGVALRDMLDAHDGKIPEHGENADRKRSGGEILFNRTVYTGIGFGLNEASSLWITDQFVHGTPKWWLGGNAFSKSGFDAASNYLSKTFKVTPARAGNAILMATLLSGGTLLLLPMRYLEEHKIYFTQKANHFLDWAKGSKMSAEEVKARDEEVATAIACSPQQTWASLLVGRAAAMLASWTTGSFLIGPERNKKVMDWSEKAITGAARSMGMNKAANNETFKRYAQLTGVETYSCAISSGVLELVSKLFAKRGTEVHDPEICRASHEKARAAKAEALPTESSADADAPQARRMDLEQYRKKKDCKPCEKNNYRDKVAMEKEVASGQTLAV